MSYLIRQKVKTTMKNNENQNITNASGGDEVSLNRLVSFWDRVYCDVNEFKWVLPEFLKPNGWEELPTKVKYENKLHTITMKISMFLTTKESRSRAWWIYSLHRTEDDWKLWWRIVGRDFELS